MRVKSISALALAVALSGCSMGSSFQPLPTATGSGPNALRRTPCAGGCGEQIQKPGLPEFLRDARSNV